MVVPAWHEAAPKEDVRCFAHSVVCASRMVRISVIIVEMGKIRSQYYQSAAFVPRGMLRHGYKEVEDVRLWGPQKKKQELQQQIMYLEQQLLGLQQQQTQWQAQQGG